MSPRISVCLVTYKNREFTDRCIESLNQTTYDNLEILHWDNSVNNIGFPAACNKLAKWATGGYLFFLNNDTLVKRDIFDKLLDSTFDITGCGRLNYKGNIILESGFAVDKYGFPCGVEGPVFYPDGALFMHRDVYENLGGFDEKTFMYGEDRDFCWRAWLSGYTVGIKHSAIFYHDSHHATGGTNYFRRYHSEKNTIRYMIKNSKSLTILWTYFLWSALELSFILFTKPMAIFRSYLPAYWWNIVNLKDTLRERKKVVKLVSPPFSRLVGKLYVLLSKGVVWG